MSITKLPDPQAFKGFKPTAPVIVSKESDGNIEEEIKKFPFHKSGVVKYFELTEMFGDKFIGRLDYVNNPVLKNIESNFIKVETYIQNYKVEYGGIKTHSSLVIFLYDENKELKTASIRRYRTESGNIIKWYKVKGSKANFIPYRLNDNRHYCLVAFGMSEALIFNILGLKYFILQSDSQAYNLPYNPYFKAIKEKLKGRDILILPDYDKSGFKAAMALKTHLKKFSNPRIIEFYKLVDNPFKSYDFRDYVKKIQDKELIIDNLVNLIQGVKQ